MGWALIMESPQVDDNYKTPRTWLDVIGPHIIRCRACSQSVMRHSLGVGSPLLDVEIRQFAEISHNLIELSNSILMEANKAVKDLQDASRKFNETVAQIYNPKYQLLEKGLFAVIVGVILFLSQIVFLLR